MKIFNNSRPPELTGREETMIKPVYVVLPMHQLILSLKTSLGSRSGTNTPETKTSCKKFREKSVKSSPSISTATMGLPASSK